MSECASLRRKFMISVALTTHNTHTHLSVMQFRFEDCHRTSRCPVSVVLNVHVSIAWTSSFAATQNGFVFEQARQKNFAVNCNNAFHGTELVVASSNSLRVSRCNWMLTADAKNPWGTASREAVCLVSRVSCDKLKERKYKGTLAKRTGGSVLIMLTRAGINLATMQQQTIGDTLKA